MRSQHIDTCTHFTSAHAILCALLFNLRAIPSDPLTVSLRLLPTLITYAQAGLLLHQFDEIEIHGRPWEFCDGPHCYTQGRRIVGRASAMLIYRGLRDRADRVAIPLPFGDRAGLIFRANEVDAKCLYGVDGSTVFTQVPLAKSEGRMQKMSLHA